MKSKFLKKTEEEIDHDDHDLEQDLDDVEVEDNGPTIASSKKNKMTVIAASSILITLVLYFLFFKGNDAPKKENLVPVSLPKVTRSKSKKSHFAFDKSEIDVSSKHDDMLESPSAPEIPSLPELPGSLVEENTSSLIPPLRTENKVQDQEQNQENGQNLDEQNTEKRNPRKRDISVRKQGKLPPERDVQLNPRYSPIIVFSGAGGGNSSPGAGYDTNIVNLNESPIDKLKKSPVTVTTTYIADRVHAINQGKILTAVLETAINTEVPGSVRAIVSRDVYGESGNDVLITRGSRLYGTYSSSISKGQGRVNISWTRLIRSDGVDLAIAFNASDQFGRSGIAGDVDNKYGSIITNSLLTSILAVGGAVAAQSLAGGDSNTTSTTNDGVTTSTGSSSAQAVADVTKTIVGTVNQIVSNSLNLSPVITVPQGTKITVVVNADMNLPSILKR